MTPAHLLRLAARQLHARAEELHAAHTAEHQGGTMWTCGAARIDHDQCLRAQRGLLRLADCLERLDA